MDTEVKTFFYSITFSQWKSKIIMNSDRNQVFFFNGIKHASFKVKFENQYLEMMYGGFSWNKETQSAYNASVMYQWMIDEKVRKK